MPSIQRKCTEERLKYARNWREKNPDYQYDYNAYYEANIERRRQQSVHYKFVKREFEKYRKILLDYEL